MSAGVAASIGAFLFLTVAFVTFKPLQTKDRSNGRIQLKKVSKSEAKIYEEAYNELKQLKGLDQFLIKKYFINELTEEAESLIEEYKEFNLKESSFKFNNLKEILEFLELLLKILTYTDNPRPIMRIYDEVYSLKNLKNELERDINDIKQKLAKDRRLRQEAYKDFEYSED